MPPFKLFAVVMAYVAASQLASATIIRHTVFATTSPISLKEAGQLRDLLSENKVLAMQKLKARSLNYAELKAGVWLVYSPEILIEQDVAGDFEFLACVGKDRTAAIGSSPQLDALVQEKLNALRPTLGIEGGAVAPDSRVGFTSSRSIQLRNGDKEVEVEIGLMPEKPLRDRLTASFRLLPSNGEFRQASQITEVLPFQIHFDFGTKNKSTYAQLWRLTNEFISRRIRDNEKALRNRVLTFVKALGEPGADEVSNALTFEALGNGLAGANPWRYGR